MTDQEKIREEKIREVEDMLEGYERGTRPLTVADIRQALQGVPDDMPVRNHRWRLLQTVADLRKELADKPDDQIPGAQLYQRFFTFAKVVDSARILGEREPAFVLGKHEHMSGELSEIIHFYGD